VIEMSLFGAWKPKTKKEVKKMKEPKGWPFKLLGNPWIDPCGGFDGPGPGTPE
jgi:hypothetical protein